MKRDKVPTHVAFIMDGNRRWAKKRGLPTFTGHLKGYNRIEPLVDYSQKRGIKYVTFWAFSTENWNRDQKEIEYLMNLFRKLFRGKGIRKLIDNGGRVVVIGDVNPFPEDIQANIKKIINDSKSNKKIVVSIGLNYGGRVEIVAAVNKLLKNKVKNIDEKIFSEALYTEGMSDPDIIVRTGGEMRLSGFLPWQSVYSELFFVDKYWPDFDEKEFDKILEEYAIRERRFGK